jgi:CubicO group peptidase (beta-lactamase class C family)
VASLDAFKQSLTVADLLTMRTGLDWSEAVYAGSPLQRLNDCRCDWLRFVLDWPMREPPGTRWEYVSGGAILLGGIVGVATRQRIDRFADELLFAPLGAEGVSWIQGLPDGLPHTGGGLYLRPRDMAKLGALIADGGRWQSRQIVPESWILESTRRVIRGPRGFGNHSADYGYLWWILSLADPMNPRPQSGDVIAAAGARGQWIFAVPSLGLVVVTTAENDDANWARPVDFLFTHIIGALTR